jgi:adenylate cyclase
MTEELTPAEFAARIGESVEALRVWQQAGLIERKGRFNLRDAERARLIRFLLARGFTLEVIARADERQDGLLDRFVSHLFPTGQLPRFSLTEVTEESGLDLELARRLWEAAGLPEHGDSMGDEDVAMARGLRITLDAGLPEDALLQLVKVYADSLRRVAEAEARLFHFYVHEQLRAEGLTGKALIDRTEAASARLEGLIEPTVLYFHRKGWISALRDDLALHVAQETAQSSVSDVPARLEAAVVFADLSRFTPLTDVMGDLVAVEVVERFSSLIRSAVSRWRGRLVKQIGDGFMLVFFEPRAALCCALEIEERAVAESHFPAVRIGAHWGEVLYREGDYVGSTVNIAARVAAEAEAHDILVTSAIRHLVPEIDGGAFGHVGPRELKGLADDIELWTLRSPPIALDRFVDPVCGMELRSADVAARLDVDGEPRAFCSRDCLRRFVAAPERYVATTSTSGPDA